MKRYVRKSSRPTKILPERDPAWFGDSAAHARAAKRGIRAKKAAKIVLSEKSKRGWLTRYEDEVARLTAKKRPTKNDVERLKELRKKVREQKASLKASKPRVKKPRKLRVQKPRVKKPLSQRKQQLLREKARAEQKRLEALALQKEQARQRRERLRRQKRERERKAAAEQTARIRELEQQLEDSRRREERQLEESRRREEEQRIKLEQEEIEQQIELNRRRQATIEASAMVDELKKSYLGRVPVDPDEFEMDRISKAVDLTLREIYSIWHGSPQIFAA